MIERGNGRADLTAWHLMSLPNMWACLQDQDTTNHWRHVTGWRKICDLSAAHLGHLREYRRGLAEAWPPESNAAARAYVGELDRLITRVQHTHDAAVANHRSLSAALHAITTSRAQIKTLHDEYAVKSRDKKAYEEILADPKAVAGSRMPDRPPVTDADLERLNARARVVMYGLSTELNQAQAALQKPPPASRGNPGASHADRDVYTPTDSPIIPPIVPAPISAFNRAAPPLTTSSSNQGTATPPAPNIGSENGSSTAHARTGVGPILGGSGAGAATLPSFPHPSPPINTSPNSSILPVSATPPVISPGPNTPFNKPGSPTAPDPLRRVEKSNLGTPAHPQQMTTTSRAAPTSGIIGTPPAAGIGQPTAGRPTSRQVNPIGGVIGGAGNSASRTGQLNSFPGTPGVVSGSSIGGNQSRIRSRETNAHTWDADNPWEVDQGVAPVVRAPEERGPIDPGPAIGLNR